MLRSAALTAVLLVAPLGAQSPWEVPVVRSTADGFATWHFPRSPSATVLLAVHLRAGVRHEPGARRGVALLLAACMAGGTRARPGTEGMLWRRGRGIDLDVTVDPDGILVTASVPAAHWREAVAGIAEHVLRPALDRASVDRARARVVAWRSAGRWSPGHEAALYDGPLGRALDPGAAAVARCTVADVAAFHATHVHTGRIVAAFAGPVEGAAGHRALVGAFAGLAPGDDRETPVSVARRGRGTTHAGDAPVTGYHLPRRARTMAAALAWEALLDPLWRGDLGLPERFAAVEAHLVARGRAWRFDLRTPAGTRPARLRALVPRLCAGSLAAGPWARARDTLRRRFAPPDPQILAQTVRRLVAWTREPGAGPGEVAAAVARLEPGHVLDFARDHLLAVDRYELRPVTAGDRRPVVQGLLLIAAGLLAFLALRVLARRPAFPDDREGDPPELSDPDRVEGLVREIQAHVATEEPHRR